MKKILLSFTVLCFTVLAFAYGLELHFEPVSNGEKGIKISYDIPEIFKEFTLDEQYQNEVSPDRSFKTRYNGREGEVHFILFADTGVDDIDFRKEVSAWNSMILRNIAGDSPFAPMRYFEGKEAANLNSDYFGLTVIGSPDSSFARGYKIAFVESAYKLGEGIVMRVFLTNDMEFLGYQSDGTVNSKADFFKYYGTHYFYDEEFEKSIKKGFN